MNQFGGALLAAGSGPGTLYVEAAAQGRPTNAQAGATAVQPIPLGWPTTRRAVPGKNEPSLYTLRAARIHI